MGRRARPKITWPEPAALRQCRDLLRHLAHPRRLHENRLARRIWAASGLKPEGTDEAALRNCLEVAVRSSLMHVSPRQRAIVERCDLAGEMSVRVAEYLHISLRHLYRERTVALIQIISRAPEEGRQNIPIVQVAPDACALQLSLTRALEQNGQWVIAAEMLERLSSELDNANQRCFVESRLARLYTDVGRYTLADEHVRCASQLSSKAEPAWLGAEAAISAALLAAATGEVESGEEIARRCCMELRSWSPSSYDPRVGEALLRALNLRSLIAIGRGDAGASTALTSEATAVARQLQNPDVHALLGARYFAILARVVAGDQSRVESDLWACHKLAIDNGQTRDALSIAVCLANYLRQTDRPGQSIELLNPLLQVARNVGVSDGRAGFFIELGNAATESGDPSLARKCLAELRSVASVSSSIYAHAQMLEARVGFAARRFEVALEAAEAAESAFARIGRARFVGPALQLQAELLAARGETARALRTMRRAVEILEETGQPHQRLVTAYFAAASLTGDPRFKAKARKVRARIEAITGSSVNR